MRLRRFRKYLRPSILTVALVATVVGLQLSVRERAFAFDKEINSCNTEESNARFSCYRETIQKYYSDNLPGLENKIHGRNDILFNDLSVPSGEDVSYAIFGTNCHTFYHAVGDFIATTKQGTKLPELVKYCPNTCTSGCIMGLYKRVALQNKYSENILKAFAADCPSDSTAQCSHEIGHNLHDKYTYAILKLVDGISKDKYHLTQPENYQYVTTNNPDLNAPFDDCKKLVSDDQLAYCFTGIGHNMFLFAEFSKDGYKSSFDECAGLDPAHQNDCYSFLIYRIGINDAATKFLSGKSDAGNALCDSAVTMAKRPDLKKHCYLGIGGGIGLFVDSEFNNIDITSDNLAKIQQAVLSDIDLCEKVESEFKEECYKGLLGTKVKTLYKTLNLENILIEEILPKIQSNFEVVG